MKLLLFLVGISSLVASGWICWRATAETREWREYVALGQKARRNEAEWGRFHDLGHRLFPDQGDFRTEAMAFLNGPGEQRRVLAVVGSRQGGARHTRLLVLDEDGGRRSCTEVPRGPCGVDCKPAPERGPWAFDILRLTPGAPWRSCYALVDDRPVLVSSAEDEE